MSPITQPPLLAWVDKPGARRGVRFLGRDGEWQRYGYDRLGILARAVAGGLRERGLRRGDAVAIVQPSGPQFIASLFGVLLAGGTASPVAPPQAFQDAAVYAAHVTGVLSSAGVRFVVAADDLHDGVAPLARAAGAHATLRASALLDATPAWTRRDPAELALLQFTSGSSGRARAVRVPYAAVAANIAALDAWVLGPGPGAVASWLPVHHDMGLVGCLLTAVVNQRDLWLMTPEQFIRSPLRYLRCFSGEGAAAATAMPTFGLDHVVRRVREDDLSDLDLSGWRSLVIGAERVDAPTLDRFHALLAPCGFRRSTFMPAYGLAEATLAVTAVPAHEPPAVVEIASSSVAVGEPVAIVPKGRPVTSVGVPLPGLAVALVGHDGVRLADGQVGEIVVRGPSVAAGYARGGGPASPSLTSFDGGALHTGDAGFVHDGQVFVLGRLGDSIKVRGRAVFADDLEDAVHEAGVARLRAAVVLGMDGPTATALVLVEETRGVDVDEILAGLSRRVSGVEAVVVRVPRRTIARTSSGKPRRRLLWDGYASGALGGEVLASEALGAVTRKTVAGGAW